MDAPLWGDTGGHTGAAPTHLHHIFPHIPHKQNNYLHAILPKRNQPPMRNPQNNINHPRAICPNETAGAVPVCPPERSRSDVSIPKIYDALCAGNERRMRPCGATRAGTQAPPLPNSIKPHGVPIPHRGYTFESAGLASATQPTLGNNASGEATPLGVVLFLITHHHHT